MKYFNELNEAYERTMMARGEPEKEEAMEGEKKPLFEGYANVYLEDGGLFEVCLFGYALYEQAERQVELNGPKERRSLVGGKPQRVRVEILD